MCSARSRNMVSTSSGSEAAAASSGFGGYWNRLQILVVMVWKPAGSARIAGEPNSVIACRKATRAPASSAGITSGMVMPALLAGALVAFLQAMTLFGSPAILALPAGFHTMTTKIWSLFQYPPKPELAAAASLPLLVLTIFLLRAEHMILGRRGYSVVGGKYGAPRLIPLHRLRWIAFIVCLAVPRMTVFLSASEAADRSNS